MATNNERIIVPTGAAAGDVGYFDGTRWRTGKRQPKGYMERFRLRYSSATAVILEAGSCRNAADDGDLSLAAEVTIPITTVAAFTATHGIDETTLVGTATTHATATFEPSASVYAEAAMTRVVRSLTGTFSTVGTAATGSGTKALTELAVGDIIRSATKGASRITAIASDTAWTLVAALPGGNCTAEAGTIYENLIVRIAAETPQRVNTISHAGTSVVVPSAWTSSTSGVTMKLGGEAASCWYFPKVVSDGTNTIASLTTQRTKPYLATVTSWRRIPCAVYNGAGGDITAFDSAIGGALRLNVWRAIPSVLAGAGSPGATWTYNNMSAAVPPTAAMAIVELAIFAATYAATAGYIVLQVQALTSGGGASTEVCAQAGCAVGTTAATAGTTYGSGCPVYVGSAGGLNYRTAEGGAGAVGGSPLYIQVEGWLEAA